MASAPLDLAVERFEPARGVGFDRRLERRKRLFPGAVPPAARGGEALEF